MHINFYANKIISIVKYMKLLSNSTHRLISHQKHLLYRSYILPIVLYGFQLWFYNKVLLLYPIKELNKMQQRAAIQVLGTFHTSPSSGIEAIADLVPIKLYLQKLSSRLQLRAHSLPSNHILKSLLETNSLSNITSHQLSLNNLTPKKWLKIKGPVVNMDNRFNKVFPSFDPFNKEFAPGYYFIDIFSNCFSFYTSSKQSNKKFNAHIQALDNIALTSSSDFSITLIVSNTSIKNQVVTFISHVHVHNKQIIKMIHHMVNVTTTEAKLFTIRCVLDM